MEEQTIENFEKRYQDEDDNYESRERQYDLYDPENDEKAAGLAKTIFNTDFPANAFVDLLCYLTRDVVRTCNNYAFVFTEETCLWQEHDPMPFYSMYWIKVVERCLTKIHNYKTEEYNYIKKEYDSIIANLGISVSKTGKKTFPPKISHLELEEFKEIEGRYNKINDELFRLLRKKLLLIADGGDSKCKIFQRYLANMQCINFLKVINRGSLILKGQKGISPEQLNEYRYLVPIKRRRVIDLRTGKVRFRTREDYFTNEFPVDYGIHNPTHYHEMMKLLYDIYSLPNSKLKEYNTTNEEHIKYIKRLFGQSISDYYEKHFNLMVGSGNQGKSVIMKLLSQVMGKFCKFTKIMSNDIKDKTANPELLNILTARCVVCPDLQSYNWELIKQLTGKDEQSARLLYSNKMQDYETSLTLWTHSNKEPNIEEEAVKNRTGLIPMFATFKENPNPKLGEKPIIKNLDDIITTEENKSAFLKICVEGAIDYFNRTYTTKSLSGLSTTFKTSLDVPHYIKLGSAKLLNENISSSPLGNFIEEDYELANNKPALIYGYITEARKFLKDFNSWNKSRDKKMKNISFDTLRDLLKPFGLYIENWGSVKAPVEIIIGVKSKYIKENYGAIYYMFKYHDGFFNMSDYKQVRLKNCNKKLISELNESEDLHLKFVKMDLTTKKLEDYPTSQVINDFYHFDKTSKDYIILKIIDGEKLSENEKTQDLEYEDNNLISEYIEEFVEENHFGDDENGYLFEEIYLKDEKGNYLLDKDGEKIKSEVCWGGF